MPKLALLSLPRPPARTITRTYTDPSQPDQSLTLTLRSLADDLHAATVAQEEAEAFALRYRENWLPHPGGDRPIQITERVAQNCAALSAMQVVEDEADRYTPEEFAALMVVMPHAYTQITEDVAALNQSPNGKEPPGNASGAAG